jgi:dTMP kinase
MRRGYLELAKASPERWAVVDNEDELEKTVARVTELVERTIANGAPAAIRAFQAEQSARPAPPPVESWQAAFDGFVRWIEQRSEREPRVAAYLLSGLAGPGIDPLRRALFDRVPEAILAGVSGLDDELSWELREVAADKYPGAVARTIGDFPFSHARAGALRRRLEAVAPNDVVWSIEGFDDDASWGVRERHFDSSPNQVMASLSTLDSERAWALRERWIRAAGGGIGKDYEDARIACKSITGLDEDRAWTIRLAARQVAPVAALSSVAGLLGPRSFSMREENLDRAPKVVMATLRRALDERAWRLRRAVAPDCKEAIDSIDSLDVVEAWQLRDACQDIWPSTVVKTLGPLADGERGRALIRRQLAKYAGNVSLLKHVAAMFLGLHRLKNRSEDPAP